MNRNGVDGPWFRRLESALACSYHGGAGKVWRDHPLSDFRQFPFTLVLYVFEGRCDILVDDGHAWSAQAGEALIVQAGVRHRIGMGPDGCWLNFAHVHFSMFSAVEILGFFAVPELVSGRTADGMRTLLNSLKKTRSPTPTCLGDRIQRGAEFCQYGFQLLRLILSVSEQRQDASLRLQGLQQIGRVVEFIDNNLHRAIKRQELAALSALSQAQFHRVFKSAIGCAPMTFVRQRKMARVELMLATTDTPIHDIAVQLGYADGFALSKVFKKYSGVSPLNYRLGVKQWQ